MAHPAIEIARGIWGASPCDLWVVGAYGAILHWDGSTWSDYSSPGGTTGQFYDVHGISSKSVFAVTGGKIFRWDGASWSDITQQAPFGNYRSVWATGPTEAFVLGTDGATSKPLVLRWDGSTWTRLPDPPALNFPLLVWSVWAAGPADVWVTGHAELYRWNGSAWTTIVPPGVSGDLLGIWGSGPDDVWVAGSQPKLAWHWDGVAWTQVTTPMTSTARIRGTSPTNLWMVGQGGQVANWCGTAWVAQTTSVPPDLFVADVAVSGGTAWIAGFDSNHTPSGAVLKRQ